MEFKWYCVAVFVVAWIVFGCLYGRTIWNSPIPSGSIRAAEMMKFLSFWFAGFGVIYSSLLTSFNALDSAQAMQRKTDFDKTENSFHYMERWDSPSIKEARDATRVTEGAADQTKSPKQVIFEIDGPEKGEPDARSDVEKEKQRNLHRSVVSMFNYFQEIELSIQKGRVNEEVLKQAFAETYVNIHGRFKPWLDKSKKNDESGFNDLEALNTRWTPKKSPSETNAKKVP
jgi:hypothetical protein